jgi:hypothetical protein
MPAARRRESAKEIILSTFASRAISSALCLPFLSISVVAEAAEPPPSDDVEVTAEPSPKNPNPAAAKASASPEADIEALRAEVREIRARQDAQGAPGEPAKAEPERPPADNFERAPFNARPKPGISVAAYLQSQYESHQDSEDQLRQGGGLLNQDRFVVRRARVRLIGDWQYAQTQIELDANSVKGFAVGLQKAEATLHYRPDPSKPAIVQGTMGLFDTPFGYELVEAPRARFFMERSQASRAFWPGEPDLGARFSGALGFFRWTIAALNGHPIGDKQFPGQDPISAKDVTFRFGAEAKPLPDLHLSGAVSALRGKGFHPGTDATKGTLEWHDQNEDGVVQPYELQSVPGTSPTPSQTFEHWAIGADVQLHYRSRLGITKVYGELVIAQNMDRALFIADPTVSSVDVRELGYYVGITQEITKYGVIGFRYDYYDPNADVFDKRGGKLIPYTQAMKTYSPMVGLVLPQRGRLLFQYDIIRDYLARSAVGVPADLKNNAWTLRLQVEL